MNFAGIKIAATKDGANTNDIIAALAAAVPAAINNVKDFVEQNPNLIGDPIKDGIYFARFIQNNVKYKQDDFREQLIQLPGRMIYDTKQADCKSFSLAWLAMMIAAGHKNSGFRFASYRPNKIFTHVYNWTLDKSGKKRTFDTTLKNLKESTRFTNLKDMKVSYLAESPTMVNDAVEIALAARDEINGRGRQRRQQRRAARQQRREERRADGKPRVGRKLFLAPVRNAFLSLVGFNVRGLATKIAEANAKDPDKVKKFWEKLGGKYDKLLSRANKSKSKKALFGKGKGKIGSTFDENENYIGVVDWGAVGTFIATATPALVAASKLFKSLKVKEGEGDVATEEEKRSPDAILDPDGQGFVATDDENKPGGSFAPSPMLIGGAVAAVALIYFLTKKK